MGEIKKIIWATDGSKESEEALDYARFFAQRFNSEIIGIHVIPMLEESLYEYFRKPESEFHNWVEKAEENYKAKLASIAYELTTQGINFRGEILKGEPSREIVGFARREKANLVVMGKRGHGLIDRMLIGSTTLRVLRESNVPVLAVKKKNREGPVDIRNILVPLDITEKANSALSYAIDLAGGINASISVVYVFRLDLYAYDYAYEILPDVSGDLTTLSSNRLTKRVEEVKFKRGIHKSGVDKLEIKTEVIQGESPPVAIVDYASSKNADLIVINTHGRKGIKRLIMGSVTEKVIQESPCSVLALKP